MKRIPRPDLAAGEAARLGEELRDARMALGWTVEDMAASLRIRRVYLTALEQGRVRDLPAPAYALGFVRSYATAVGLDPDEMVRRFREVTGSIAPRRSDLVFPEPVPERGMPPGALILTGVVLAVGAYVAWYNWSGTGTRTVDTVPPVPARIEQLAREVSPPPAPVAVEPPAAPAPTPTAAAAAPPPVRPADPAAQPAAGTPAVPRQDQSRVVLRVRNTESWVQVREGTGGTILLNRTLKPGETWQVPNRNGLTLTTGNVLGLEFIVDGQVLPPVAAGSAQVRRDINLDADKLKTSGLVSVTPPPRPAPPPAPAQPAAPRPMPTPPGYQGGGAAPTAPQ